LSEEYSSGNRDNLLWFVVVVMMVVNVGVLTYTTVYNGGDGTTLSALETEMENLRFRLNNALQEIENLQEEIRIASLPPDTPNLGLIELYNTSRNSVVLIDTNTGSGSGWVYDTLGHIITNNHVI